MDVIGRWKITAPRSPRRGANWQLECGALDGQIIPAGGSAIVVPEQQLRVAVEALREIAAFEVDPTFEVDPDDGWDYSVGVMRAIAAHALDALGEQ